VAYSCLVERRTGLISISVKQADALASAILPGTGVRACNLLPGGSSNSNYKLYLTDGHLAVLRIYARDENAAAKEAALYHLLNNQIPMAAVLGTCPSGTAGLAHACALFEYVPGLPLAQTRPGYSTGYAIGRALADIGRYAFERPGDVRGPSLSVEPWGFGEDASRGFVEWCVNRTPAGERLGLVLSKRLLNFVAASAERWPELHTQSRLVHGDFNPSNLLVAGGTLTAVLDWEWAHSGSPLADLANLLRDREQFPLSQAFVDGVLQGLAEGGVILAHDWFAQAEYLDLLSAVEFLSSTADRPQVHANALAQIKRTLDAHKGPA
jgi:Ser/Thr protein kinase RdoA (MazF antagonist)